MCVRSVLCFISVLIVHHNRVKEHYFIMIYARFMPDFNLIYARGTGIFLTILDSVGDSLAKEPRKWSAPLLTHKCALCLPFSVHALTHCPCRVCVCLFLKNTHTSVNSLFTKTVAKHFSHPQPKPVQHPNGPACRSRRLLSGDDTGSAAGRSPGYFPWDGTPNNSRNDVGKRGMTLHG